jgi:outer membrane lipoprotein-sorting protein
MNRVYFFAGCLLWLGVATNSPVIAAAAAAAHTPAAAHAPASLSVDQIVERNVAARGGLAAWRATKTLTIAGDMDAGGKPNHALPFVLKEKRTRKSRLEIVFKDQTSVQVYDGTQGWKVRPFLNRNEVEAYTPAEMKSAAAEQDLDGPLVDYAAKGTQIELAGSDPVERHPAYKLKLTLHNGEKRNLWIDAGTFLELKMEGEPRKVDGRLHNVALYFRDYKTEHGLTTARLQETAVEGVKQTYKMTISRVTVNEPLDDSLFQRPQLAALATPGPTQH